jgi:hypothetical protein
MKCGTSGRPQVVQRGEFADCGQPVYKFLVAARQLPQMHSDPLALAPFLPTIKLQLSQLPMIVGLGRVAIRRALFSCAHYFNSIT